jgi:hypothetical protein
MSTYLFGILSQRVVHLDRFLDHSLVGDLEEREADNLWHFGGLSFSVRKADSPNLHSELLVKRYIYQKTWGRARCSWSELRSG